MFKSPKLLPLFAALLGLLCGPIHLTAAPAFPQDTSDLKPDPALHFGALPNGLRYVVMANHEPKGRASLRLYVNAGALNETDAQRGLAHFLEHLAFNGSTHYPPGTLVEFFQHNGMSFGGDTNAYTSYDQTVYQLELPDTKADTFEKALTLFADYSGGLLLEPASIEKERGIILSEKRTRDSADYRMEVAGMEFLLSQTRLPLRQPIGLADIVSHAQRDQFKDFYDTWYRPENITVVVVGDFNSAQVEAQLVRLLTPVAAHGPARTPPSLGTIPVNDTIAARFYPEPDANATKVSIQSVVPFTPLPDLAANRLRTIPRELAIAMLNRRLSILAKQEGAPFSDGGAGVEEGFRLFRNASIGLTCKPGQWSAALAVAEQELRRALTYGFEPAELNEIVSGWKNNLEQSVRIAATRRSPGLADGILGELHDHRVFTSPATDLALYAPALDKVTPDECVAALRAVWGESKGCYLFVTGNLTLADPEKQILAAYAASQAVAVSAPGRTAGAQFAYTDFGPAGTVVKRTHIADLDLTLVEFANGVRLNLKQTTFEANRIYLGMRVGYGLLTQPLSQPGLGVLAGSVFTAGGLGRHSIDDLQRMLAGKTVGIRFQVGSDALSLSGGTNREDLLLQCQLLAAYLSDPGYRPEAMRQAEKGFDQMYTELAHSVNGPLESEVPNLIANGDPRFGLPSREGMSARTLDEVKTWLAPQLAHGAMEIAIAGDLDVEATIAAVARTFGALPVREARPALATERTVQLAVQGFKKDYRVPSTIPKGLVAFYWPTTDASEVHRTRRLNLLTEVISDRLRVKLREQLGDVYSPHAGLAASDTFPGFGYITTDLTVEPTQAELIADTVRGIAKSLHDAGVTEDELQRAKLPLLTKLHESARTNGYWLGNVLAKAQEKPEMLDWCRTRMADTEAITKPELDALAQQYLGAERVYEVISLPTAMPAASAK